MYEMNFTRFCLIIALFSQLTSYGQTLVINEFEARNETTVADSKGDHDDWLEILNTGDQSINLNGYYITDDLSNKTKFKFSTTGNEFTVPSKGILLFWADKDLDQGINHLNFKLSGDSGVIALFSSDLKLIDSVSYHNQLTDVSMGRDPSVQSVWKYYTTPTPGQPNGIQGFTGIAGNLIFNQPSGCYNASLGITITSTRPTDTIRYTLDNSDPDENSPIYKSSLIVSKTQVVRAATFSSGFLSRGIKSQIYIENLNPNLPILAIITDSTNLYGSTGIYTHYDESGDAWERFCQLKYIKNGKLETESNAGIRIQGGSSTFMSKKSLRLFFRDKYGNGSFKYPVFGAGKLSSFDKLVLKSGYDDDITYESTRTGTLLRDALSVELWKQTGGLPQLSSWAVLYLNNRYWGIYDIRESIEEQYIKDHTGFTNFDLVRFHNEGPELKYGTLDSWNNLYNLVKNSDFSGPENYNAFETMVDINDFVNLMAFVQCSQYYSWGWGVSMYRNASGGKWFFSIWDTDRAYTDVSWNSLNPAKINTGTYMWANIFLKKLLSNPTLRQKLHDRIEVLLNTTFKPENAIHVLDSIYTIVKPEIPSELGRWNPKNDKWEDNVEAVREFLRQRPDTLRYQMDDYLDKIQVISEKEIFSVYPDPVISRATIRFNMNRAGKVDLSIYDESGRIIKNIFQGSMSAGIHTVGWESDFTKPGIYIVRLKTLSGATFKKIMKQ